MISSHKEAMIPEIRNPLAYGMDDPDQFTLIHG
jgi:hypothetical protein